VVVVDVLPYSRKLASRLSVIRGTVHSVGASMHLEHPTVSIFVVFEIQVTVHRDLFL